MTGRFQAAGFAVAGFAVLALATATGFIGQAEAQQRIGAAALVRNEVVQVRGAATSPISLGDSIVRNEVVRTGTDSNAKVVFLDNTNLAIGAGSTVTMDRFVFSGGETAAQVGVNVVRGALRFSSGSSNARAYDVRTPVATIGVRGTILDLRHVNGVTTVALVEGAATVCPRGNRTRCIDLNNPGDVAVVSSAGVASRGVPGSFSSAGTCNSVGGLCGRQSFASVGRIQVAGGRNPIAPTAELCGR
jgi:ferric-dicitrate binding protein FerR (iron transport regulator)